MEDQWTIAKYNSEWKPTFLTLAMKLRNVLGEAADRIDHVGSTSIEGMDAKPIVDIQISVTDFDNESLYREQIESLGFEMRRENPDKRKKYFRELPGETKLWGKGIEFNASLHMIGYGAKQLGITIFYAETHETNTRSRRMLEKLGFEEISRIGFEEYLGKNEQLIQYRYDILDHKSQLVF
ncbi:bifunctional GrpB family protein/GNAT family N-acetyltransferase [Paenibacillus polygoni]|uniref:Bifunctional GrpB family protein/GNAT family N-acetyltransferase n=1 Tax=Paenibacillus polygoni TaxID=3050112 RepID=A0ABY8X9R8_9BACL|nr:bifunctional GrpB family protein/GNAT family N-acetyltransferase [Paenibacillus polygoni]WIV21226.1 bifunctional GrpB family protein/GNAT family N-acetyltransferase [Paenibacillus polygoni]